MDTPICPTCNCSLVRLKISRDKAASSHYDGEEYYFCCQGCADTETLNLMLIRKRTDRSVGKVSEMKKGLTDKFG